MIEAPQIALGHSSDIAAYSSSFIRFVFVPLHAEAYLTAYESLGPASSAAELARLHHEFMFKPTRHVCACVGSHCAACARYQVLVQSMGSEVVIGRSTPVHAPMPNTLLLDLEMALSVLGRRGSTPERIARYLREGT